MERYFGLPIGDFKSLKLCLHFPHFPKIHNAVSRVFPFGFDVAHACILCLGNNEHFTGSLENLQTLGQYSKGNIF